MPRIAVSEPLVKTYALNQVLQGDEAPAVFGGGKTKAEVVELVLNVAKDLDYFIYDDLEAALKTNEILRHMMWEQIEDASNNRKETAADRAYRRQQKEKAEQKVPEPQEGEGEADAAGATDAAAAQENSMDIDVGYDNVIESINVPSNAKTRENKTKDKKKVKSKDKKTTKDKRTTKDKNKTKHKKGKDKSQTKTKGKGKKDKNKNKKYASDDDIVMQDKPIVGKKRPRDSSAIPPGSPNLIEEETRNANGNINGNDNNNNNNNNNGNNNNNETEAVEPPRKRYKRYAQASYEMDPVKRNKVFYTMSGDCISKVQQCCQRTGALATISIAYPDTFGGVRGGGLLAWASRIFRDEPLLQPHHRAYSEKLSNMYNEWLTNKQHLQTNATAAPPTVSEAFKNESILKVQRLLDRYGSLDMIPERKLVHLYWMFNPVPLGTPALRKQCLVTSLGFQSEADLREATVASDEDEDEDEEDNEGNETKNDN